MPHAQAAFLPGADKGCDERACNEFNLLRRLLEREQEVLHFPRDLGVPFTNNLAERAIRMPKVKQRISGCFRTVLGAENFCTIRSCLGTARKQGFGMLHAMRAVFSGQALALA